MLLEFWIQEHNNRKNLILLIDYNSLTQLDKN